MSRRKRPGKPEAVVEGKPVFTVTPENEEPILDALADLLLADLGSEEPERRR